MKDIIKRKSVNIIGWVGCIGAALAFYRVGNVDSGHTFIAAAIVISSLSGE